MKIVNNIEIREGAIRVNDIVQVIDLDDVKVYEVDLHSKYPGPIGYGWLDDETITVMLYADEQTLGVNEGVRDDPTDLKFELPGDLDEWQVVAEGSRYTVQIVFYRRDSQ